MQKEFDGKQRNADLLNIFNKLINSKNPLIVIYLLIKYQLYMKDFINDATINIEQLNSLSEKRIQTDLVDSLYKTKYHKNWINWISNYVVASRNWNDRIYLEAYLSLTGELKYRDKFDRKEISKQTFPIENLKILSFKQTKRLVDMIEQDFIKDSEIEKLDSIIIKKLNKIIPLYRNPDFYKMVSNIINFQNKTLYWKYIKTQIINKYFPRVLKSIYWKCSSLYFNKKDFLEIKRTMRSLNNHDLSGLRNLKDIILGFDNIYMSSIFRPILQLRIFKSLNIKVNSPMWFKIKNFVLFNLCENYIEYNKLYEYFTEIEYIMRGKWYEKLKIWGFWIVTLPIILIILSLFLPLGIFIPIIVFLVKGLSKMFKNIKEHTEYKIKFNFGVNIILGISMVGFFTTSVLFTNGDSYKSGYEKIKGIINTLSVVTSADLLGAVNNAGNILGAENSTNEKFEEIKELIDYDYSKEKGSFYEKEVQNNYNSYVDNNLIYNLTGIIDYINQNFEQKETNIDTNLKCHVEDSLNVCNLDQNDIIKNEMYFYGTKKLGDGIYLWNLIDIILARYQYEYNFELNEQEKYLLVRSIAKQYTTMNMESFRKNSVLKNQTSMSWENLNKWISNGFEIKMAELESITVKKLLNN